MRTSKWLPVGPAASDLTIQAPPAEPKPHKAGRTLKLVWIPAIADEAVGYGKISAYLPRYVNAAGAESVGYRAYDWDWRIAIGGPRAYLMGRGTHVIEDFVYHTMFEARPIPPDYLGVLNRSRAIWVPSAWVRDLFIEGGVTQPIFVSGYGVNRDFFHAKYNLRTGDEPYTFLWCGTALGDGENIGDRKGGELVWQAFRKLNLPDSRLILKAGQSSAIRRIVGDDRIMLSTGNLPEADYAMLLASADCFVYPSRGEGFGLQPLEAMAIGLPVIAPAYSGMADFVKSDTAIVLPVQGEVHAHLYSNIYNLDCAWAELSLDDVCDRMRWAYDHREEAKAIGCRAAAWVAKRWTWQEAGKRAYKALLAIK